MKVVLRNKIEIDALKDDTGIFATNEKGQILFLTQSFLDELIEFRHTNNEQKKESLKHRFNARIKGNVLF